MAYSFKTNTDHNNKILIYWVDSKGKLGKRLINKYRKDSSYFVTSAMSEEHATELMAVLTK